MNIAGRQAEIATLQDLLKKNRSEFLAVYGRRRVGKTFIVREVYKKNIVFECSGLHQKEFSQQLENFWLTLHEYSPNSRLAPSPKTWLQAFSLLKAYLNTLKGEEKKVIFLDEIPWFETPKSGFLAALDNFWNQYCTKRDDIILVICGSAASWIINKVINDTGGLHNRVTKHLQLMPFTLSETKSFLALQGVRLTNKDIALLYMCIGGIPFYLRDIEPGQSVPQILDSMFFAPQATLRHEFQNLYAALFKNSAHHEAVVGALSKKSKGLTRAEIIAATQINSGGALTMTIRELIECGFVKQIFPVHKTKEESLFRLMDEFTLFYFKFLSGTKANNSWLLLANQAAFKSWSGYAFENLAIRHAFAIKKALGIHGVITNEYAWQKKKDDQSAGVQIDFIIDRADNCINLLEMKFYQNEYEMTEKDADSIRKKIQVFQQQTNTHKNIFPTLLTVFGAVKNKHYLSIISHQLSVEDLFA
ncbi:MAG: ATP-binding protein [Saprospiraceae bacterium]